MNKKLKKLVLIIAAVVLAVILLVTGTILIVKNVGDSVLKIESQTVLAGDKVSLTVSINKNPGIYYGLIPIDYDPNSIRFVSCANGEVFDECEVNNINGTAVILVNQSALKDSKKDGIIATLNFEVSEKARKGNYTISFGSETGFCNVKNPEDLFVPKLNDGKLTVK